MAITRFDRGARNYKRGIALLITLIFMSVMLAFGLALAALAYKQSVLSSSAVQSQKAFFAADGALECALYVDQNLGAFIYGEHSGSNLADPSLIPAACGGVVDTVKANTYSAQRLVLAERIAYNRDASGNYLSCADIVIYKYPVPLAIGRKSFLFSTGYNVPCNQVSVAAAGGRIVVRGIFERY